MGKGRGDGEGDRERQDLRELVRKAREEARIGRRNEKINRDGEREWGGGERKEEESIMRENRIGGEKTYKKMEQRCDKKKDRSNKDEIDCGREQMRREANRKQE